MKWLDRLLDSFLGFTLVWFGLTGLVLFIFWLGL